jgi:hypothetical protein
MLPLSETQILQSFVNASHKEITDLSLPLDFATIDWDRLDYFGWRDRRSPRRAYVVVRLDDSPVGVLLRQSEVVPRTRAQCSWCQDITLTNEVVFYGAKRAGDAGRKGDTVGTLICANLGCSANARKRPSLAYIGFDVDAAREKQIIDLSKHAEGFVRAVLGDPEVKHEGPFEP